nr:reverse transcriptase domain-containing protein [Tanacetum cinerariifolium]
MSTQQDIYAASSENHPSMLNKDKYVPWSSRIIRYARSKINGKMIVDSIENGRYVSDDGNPSRANIKQALGSNSLVHSYRALSTLRRSGLRTANAAAKPCQGDSLEFYLITGRTYDIRVAEVLKYDVFIVGYEHVVMNYETAGTSLKIVKEEEPNDEWVNPTSDDNIILGNYVKKCLSNGPIWYKMGYPLPHKLDENEHPYTATCQCCKRGIEVQNDLREFHEKMREIHYSLNNILKLLCSMVEPLAKAVAQYHKK